jgi:hypothetical protein
MSNACAESCLEKFIGKLKIDLGKLRKLSQCPYAKVLSYQSSKRLGILQAHNASRHTYARGEVIS